MKIKFPKEAAIWVIGLVFLACIDPDSTGIGSICPLHNLGLDLCPGCGLGRSIAHLLKGQFMASWQAHPLGIIVLPTLVYRSVYLLIHYIKLNKKPTLWHQ